MFRQKECDLKTALEALRISERTHEQLKQLATEEQETLVHTLRMDPQSRKRKPINSRGKLRNTPSTASSQYCGGNHSADRASCPAYGKTCNHYGKPNHFRAVCRQRRIQINKTAASLALVDNGGVSTDSEESAFMVEEIGLFITTGKVNTLLNYILQMRVQWLPWIANWTQEPHAM